MCSTSSFEAASVRNAMEPGQPFGVAGLSASSMTSFQSFEPGRASELARMIGEARCTTAARELSWAEEPSWKKTILGSIV